MNGVAGGLIALEHFNDATTRRVSPKWPFCRVPTRVLCNFLASLAEIDQKPEKTLRKVYTQASLPACLD